MQDKVEELSTSAPRARRSTRAQTEPLEDEEDDDDDDDAAECMRTAVTHQQQTRIPPSSGKSFSCFMPVCWLLHGAVVLMQWRAVACSMQKHCSQSWENVIFKHMLDQC